MKLLLTSNCISNKTIEKALRELVRKDLIKCTVSFIPTAANSESVAFHDKGWLVKDMMNVYKLGFKNFYIVDLQTQSKKLIHEHLKKSDVIVVGGGDTFHLEKWMKKSGTDKLLKKIIKSRVYVGISAGSLFACRNIQTTSDHVEKFFYKRKKKLADLYGLGFIDIHFRPHLNSRSFPLITSKVMTEFYKKLKPVPMYALDNNMALKIEGKKITPVGEGEFVIFSR